MHHISKTLLALRLALGGLAVVAAVVAVAAMAVPRVAEADTGRRVKAKTDQAMAEYDMMEFESARSLLLAAIALGEDESVRGPELANAYLNLGIVYFSGIGDEAKAGIAFASALGIEPSIGLSVAYSTPEMSALLERSRAKLSPAGGGCERTGLTHTLVDEAAASSSPEIRVSLGTKVRAARVSLYFRGEGESEFQSTDMAKEGKCAYVAHIPASALHGSFVHYYVSAVNARGKDVGHKGTSGSPNIIEVAKALGIQDDEGDSLLRKAESKPLAAQEGAGHRVFLSIGAGSGFGYVQGPTEKNGGDVNCCTAPAPFHLLPEIGYYLSDKLSLSVAVRMGFPLGANVSGHATFAPAGLLRLRYSLNQSGEGLQFSASVGGGMIRNVVPIRNSEPGMDVDTTVMGPVLFGGGLGYAKSLGGPIRLVAEFGILGAATFGIQDLGGCPGDGCVHPKGGAEADATLALLLAF